VPVTPVILLYNLYSSCHPSHPQKQPVFTCKRLRPGRRYVFSTNEMFFFSFPFLISLMILIIYRLPPPPCRRFPTTPSSTQKRSKGLARGSRRQGREQGSRRVQVLFFLLFKALLLLIIMTYYRCATNLLHHNGLHNGPVYFMSRRIYASRNAKRTQTTVYTIIWALVKLYIYIFLFILFTKNVYRYKNYCLRQYWRPGTRKGPKRQ
jgi:hypothetical protein